MSNGKEIVFLIKVMCGGGAERVISLLSRAAVERGYNVGLVLTHQNKSDAVLKDVDKAVSVVSLPEEIAISGKSKILPHWIMLFARVVSKAGFKEKAAVLKYLSHNFESVRALKKYFSHHKPCTAIAFLYDSIFLSLLSVNKLNRLIISERGDPQQSIKSKTTMSFLKNEFCKADGFVFQSPDVQKWYEENTSVRGTVIFNPIKSDLPEPYSGERKKRVVNFCRISAQKNIVLLLDAFELFYKEHPDYDLYVYGDPVGNDCDGYMERVKSHIDELSCKTAVRILPSRSDIHLVIRDYAMFVSSSDFEGMSNSMLEAMALGLPCICTDCPAGGARAVITDGENGLLTPVGDAKALYLAMKRVAENPELAERLSGNAVKIREEQSVDKIIGKWMEIING